MELTRFQCAVDEVHEMLNRSKLILALAVFASEVFIVRNGRVCAGSLFIQAIGSSLSSELWL